MIVSALGVSSFVLFATSWWYSILACQVAFGFPPFYFSKEMKTRFPDYENEHMNAILKDSYLMALSMLFLVLGSENLGFSPLFFWIAWVPAAVFGWRRRAYLKAAIGSPFPFLAFFFPRQLRSNGLLVRHPMIVFEIWVIGLSALMGAVVLYGTLT